LTTDFATGARRFTDYSAMRGYFPRFFSTGNDLTGRGALPMFPAACELRLGRGIGEKPQKSLG
jgi:hypothetical protein